MIKKPWTPERDEELIRHKVAGLSSSKIAALLHTTRGCVLGRFSRLRNKLSKTVLEQIKRKKIAAAEAHKKALAEKAAAETRRKAEALQDKIFSGVRADLAAGVDRDVVIKRAITGGAQCGAVAEFFDLPARASC